MPNSFIFGLSLNLRIAGTGSELPGIAYELPSELPSCHPNCRPSWAPKLNPSTRPAIRQLIHTRRPTGGCPIGMLLGCGCVGVRACTCRDPVNTRTSVHLRLSMVHVVSPKSCLMCGSFSRLTLPQDRCKRASRAASILAAAKEFKAKNTGPRFP